MAFATWVVAVAGNQVLEIIDRQEPGIYLNLLETGINKGPGISGGLIAADVHRPVDRRVAGAFRKAHCLLVAYRTDQVVKPGIRTDNPLESFLDNVKIRLFKIFAEEIGRHLYGECGIYKGNRPDFLEPGLEMLGFNYLRDDLQTVVPTVYMIPYIFHRFLMCKNG